MRVAILVEAGVSDSGLALFRDVFVAANLLRQRVDPHIGEFEVSLHATAPHVLTCYGLAVDAEPLAPTLSDPPDHLLVPSLGLVTAGEIIGAVSASDTLGSIRDLHDAGVRVGGACSGTFYLAESGLLAERDATTSWWLGPAFRARYPDVRLDESQALVVSDSLTTSGAALAHLDLALSIVGRVSPALSDAVGDYLAVGDRPQQRDVVRPALLPHHDPTLTRFDQAVREGLAGPLDIGLLAAAVGVSQRTLQRLTGSTLGLTPVQYIQQVRLERAVDLLRTTDLTLTSVAHAVGYQDATTLGTLIRRRRGTTPQAIRRRRGH